MVAISFNFEKIQTNLFICNYNFRFRFEENNLKTTLLLNLHVLTLQKMERIYNLGYYYYHDRNKKNNNYNSNKSIIRNTFSSLRVKDLICFNFLHVYVEKRGLTCVLMNNIYFKINFENKDWLLVDLNYKLNIFKQNYLC